jgi:hypothetical protein
MKMKKTISITMLIILLIPSAFAGLGSKKAQYVGGTANLKEGAEGTLDASHKTNLVFKEKNGDFTLPYSSVTALSYGQHAGRRIGAAIALSAATAGIYGLPMLFSKKRRHYLTVSYTTEPGKDEAVIFQLGKDVTRAMLATLQARTGKTVEYEDDEARKSGNK